MRYHANKAVITLRITALFMVGVWKWINTSVMLFNAVEVLF